MTHLEQMREMFRRADISFKETVISNGQFIEMSVNEEGYTPVSFWFHAASGILEKLYTEEREEPLEIT